MSTNQVPSLSISDWWNFAAGVDTAVDASLHEYLLDGPAGPLSQDTRAPSLQEPESKRA